jgi:hypothetical protein
MEEQERVDGVCGARIRARSGVRVDVDDIKSLQLIVWICKATTTHHAKANIVSHVQSRREFADAILSIIHNTPSETALSMTVAFYVSAAFIPVIIQTSRPSVDLSHVLSTLLLPMSKRRLSSSWAQLMPLLESDSVQYLRRAHSLRITQTESLPRPTYVIS